MIKQIKELSPDLVSRTPSRLVPLRSRFPKSRIKELPGWRYYGSQSPDCMKVTSTKPFKVNSKGEFHSQMFFATDERKNFICQSKSSNILPRLYNQRNLKLLNSQKTQANLVYANESENKETEKEKEKGKASISVMVHQDGDSDVESQRLDPLFSHRSIQGSPKGVNLIHSHKAIEISKFTPTLEESYTQNDKIEFITYSEQKSKPNHNSERTPDPISSPSPGSIPIPKTGETKKPSLIAKGSKLTNGSSSSKRLQISSRSRSRNSHEPPKSTPNNSNQSKHPNAQENFENTSICSDSQEKIHKSSSNQANNPTSNPQLKKLLKSKPSHLLSLDPEINSNHARTKPKKPNHKSQNNASNSRISEEYLENPDDDLYDKLNMRSKLNRKAGHDSSQNSDSDPEDDESLSSLLSDNDEEGLSQNKVYLKYEENDGRLNLNEDDRVESKKESWEGNDSDSDRSVTFSPKVTKRKLYANTVTSVTNPSTTTNQSPVVKTPEVNGHVNKNKTRTRPPVGKKLSKLKTSRTKKNFDGSKEANTLRKSRSKPDVNKKRKGKAFKTQIEAGIKSGGLRYSELELAQGKNQAISEFKDYGDQPLNEIQIPKSKHDNLAPSESQDNLSHNSELSNAPKSPKNAILASSSSKSRPRATLRPTLHKSKRKFRKATGKINDHSSSSDDLKLSIRITEVPDGIKDLTYSQNNDPGRSLLQQDELSDLNKSSLSAQSFLKVLQQGRNNSRLSSREVSKRELFSPEGKKPETKRPKKIDFTKADEISRISSKNRKKKGDDESSDFDSSDSGTSGFSSYSAIKKIEIEQKFIKKSETLARKNALKTSIGMKYMKSYLSTELKKQVRKLDPISNFIYNFSFSILKSIKNLIKVSNLIGLNKRISRQSTMRKARLEREQLEKDLILKNKLKTNKNQNEFKKTLTRHAVPAQKPARTQNKLQTFYPREIALKEMHSAKASPRPQGKKKKSFSITAEDEKSSQSFEESSESSFELPVAQDRSKKSLLYELSHQELIVEIAKQILNNKNSEDGSEAKSLRESTDGEEASEEFGAEIRDIASKLRSVPKGFAFGPNVNLNLLKQNQILFDFKELEQGKFDIDFENLNKFSRKQEFLGLSPSPAPDHFSPYTLQVLPQDIITEDQQYRSRLKKATIVGKKLRRRREKMNFSPAALPGSVRAVNLAARKDLSPQTDDFDERVYLRLKGSPVFLMQSQD